MKLGIDSGSSGPARCDAGRQRRSGSYSLATLAALCSLSCSGTSMITPNAYSESVGQQVLRADKDACYRQGVEEKKRLLAELRGGDPALAALEGKESAGGDASRTVAIGDAHRGSTRGLIGSDRVAGTAGVAAGEFLLSAWDLDPYDEEYLANYLGTFTATKRLAYICLRAKGYRVEDHEEDGSGAASLVLNPARVVLREENGREVVFYGSSP